MRKTWNRPGDAHFLTFSCYHRSQFLRSEQCCEWLALTIKNSCAKLDYRLWAYVFMPEHVHLIVYPNRVDYRISEFSWHVKQPMANRVQHKLKRDHPDYLERACNGNPQGIFRFWQHRGYDRNLVSVKSAIQKAEYCHANPVKRGLVTTADQWKWSSFHKLVLGKDQPSELIVDDWVT